MPTDREYQELLAFRVALRRFNDWSRRQAEAVGLTHAQHQLLLAVRGSSTEGGPTIGEVAEVLGVRHHSATELIDRCQALGLLERSRDREDARRVHLGLTGHGLDVLNQLTEVHLAELRGLAAALAPVSSVPTE